MATDLVLAEKRSNARNPLPYGASARPEKRASWGLPIGYTIAALLLVLLGREVIISDNVGSDFLCYWTAGRLLASGQSPYDTAAQAHIQRDLGWDRERTGLGLYDFLPYYYPPWFGLAFIPLLSLGYAGAKLVWFFFNLEITFVSGHLLGQTFPGVPRGLLMLLVPVFVFSLISLILGQTVLLTLFLLLLVWRLLETGKDGWAGVALACLTLKPQLTGILVAALLVWLLRQRRWSAVKAFVATLAVLSLGSCLVLPTWPLDMLQATRQIPPPTHYFPWIGTSWLLLLRTFELQGWTLWLLYLAAAVPLLGLTARAALTRTGSLRDVLGLSLLTAFVVAPYARHYDFPVLLIPALLLLHNRLATVAGRVWLVALIALPYAQLVFLVHLKEVFGPSLKLHGEIAFGWIPLGLILFWCATRRAASGLAPSR